MSPVQKHVRTPPLGAAFYAKRAKEPWSPVRHNAKVAREKKRAEAEADAWLAEVKARASKRTHKEK